MSSLNGAAPPVPSRVNVSDFYMAGALVPHVGEWRDVLTMSGLDVLYTLDVETPRMRNGANGKLRAESEAIIVARPARAYSTEHGAPTCPRGVRASPRKSAKLPQVSVSAHRSMAEADQSALLARWGVPG